MISQETQDTLSILMIRASLRGKFGMHALADSHGITLMQAFTVCLLEPDGLVQMNTLSSFLGCDPSSVTLIVERLYAVGLVDRTECPDDRRKKKITLTPKGLTLRRQLLQTAADMRLPNLGALTQEQTQQLIFLLETATADPQPKAI